jgi:pimeloyl-ACP methyl ester carboxylesterase
MTRVLLRILVALPLALSGCGDDSTGKSQTSTESADPTTAPNPLEPEEGDLSLASGRSVHYRCVGQGTPAILLEAGTDSGGTDSLGFSFVDPLAEATRVCTYDRLGTGLSDPPPNRKRTIDDLCDVQDEVREELGLSGRSVLAGQSGGANLVIWCANRRPESVAALISIEGYHDDPADLAAEGFHWRDNPERADWVESSEMLDEMSTPIGRFPVLVITATDAGLRGIKNQKYWLALSAESRQVVLQGGHDLHEEVPDEVAAEILKELP